MTRKKTFKRRVRERMAKTGEKYGAARRVLLDQAAPRDPRAWVSQPQHSEALVTQNTGRGWDEWRDLIEAWPDHSKGHKAVASWLQAEHGIDGWWAQAVTVGWERISGRRLPGQMADGTFTANTSTTISTAAEALRELLLDDAARDDLFPGLDTTLRSRPTSKNIRLGFPEGVAMIWTEPKQDGRVTIGVQHAKLPSSEAAQHWKSFWAEWFAALDEA